MKRFFIALITFLVFCESSHANHTKGGWMYYEYLGQGIADPSKLRYKIGLILYIDCASSLIEPTWNFSFFNGASPYTFIQDITVSASSPISVSGCTTSSCYPCLSPVPPRCYQIITYETTVELTPTPDGYIVSKQRCCRITAINNLIAPSTQWGATYTIKIPGTNDGPTAPQNSSPKFIFNDTAVVCANNPFTLSFQANDLDGDSLVYSFCSAYHGADQSVPNPGTAAPPPYGFVSYQSPYNGSSPLGFGVSINSQTGLISGIAPPAGEYVVCVCVSEYRNGVYIGETRKEIHLKTAVCDLAKAFLAPRATTCDGFTLNFKNDDPFPSPLINTYFWDFGVTWLTNDTSNLPTPTYTYPDTGTYVVKLITNKYGQCSDSTTTTVRVFPGFRPDFIDSGGCVSNPFKFFDATATDYGVVDSWSWNFGDGTTLADTSHLQNPQWTYATSGTKTVTLIVTNSKGCVDTKQITIDVLDKPTITLGFNDVLICIPDSITLNASGTGNISWTPLVRIINANTPSPTVFPVVDTWYVAHLDDNGCINEDSVHVRVTSGVSMLVRGDTTICLTDAVQLSVVTNATSFQWTPAATLNNPNIANPIATPVDPVTTYQVLASVGTCFNVDDVTISTVPYPGALAGKDEIVCYNKSAQLNASINGNSFTWSPTKYLSDSTILNPIASPPRTTTYILTVHDNRGCPKPGRDTIVITVNPKVRAYAGRDTAVVVNQPLQFTGSGGVTYLWSPSTGLTNPNIYNPIGVYGLNIDSVRYKLVVTDGAGCPDSAYVTVRVYKVKPTIFVPTAFTPNDDGLNDTVYPISVGIKKINYFSIYNRWGELVFTTTQDRHGWDGKIAGKPQSSAVFVWMVSAIDYIGRPVFLKGTVALIR